MSDERPAPATIEEVLAALEQTSYGELLQDHERRRHLLATMMADSTDQVVREIGQQLRDGMVTPGQVLQVPEYWESLEAGYDTLAEVDLDEVAEQVDEIRRQERDRADPEAGGWSAARR